MALVELAEHASWAHVVWLLRGVLDRAATDPAARPGGAAHDDLFGLADAAAALVDAPVTIEDAHSRVLAYSSRQDVTDPARVSTIVGRRVPEPVLASLRSRGSSAGWPLWPFVVPADPEAALPRFVVPVRAGGEWLGSIWVVVDGRPPEGVVRELVQTASVVALHLLRLRAQSDLARRVSADRLRAALRQRLRRRGVAAPGPWRVVCLGEGAPLDLWESVCRRRAWHQPLLAELDGRAYAVVRDVEDQAPGTWAWLRGLVGAAVAEDLALTAAAGGPAHAPVSSSAPGPRRWRPSGSGGAQAAAAIEDLWAAVTIERAAAACAGALPSARWPPSASRTSSGARTTSSRWRPGWTMPGSRLERPRRCMSTPTRCATACAEWRSWRPCTSTTPGCDWPCDAQVAALTSTH